MWDSFKEIQFDKKNHSYSLRGKFLTPVTELISTLQRDTDWIEQAKIKSVKEGVSSDLILKRWQENSQKAMQNGSKVHSYIERRLKFGIGTGVELPEMIAFDRFWQKAKQFLSPSMIEWPIGDYELGIGGTIDCLFYSSKTGKYHPIDWKTGKSFSSNNSFQNLKSPFDDLEDCHLIRYSLQLSSYKLILARNTGLDLGDGYIIYLGENYGEYKALDFSARLQNWLLTKL